MEVYSAVFSSEMLAEREIKAEILNEESFLEYLNKGNCVFLGDGVAKFEAICSHPNAVFIQDAFPSSEEMAAIAEIKHQKSDTVDVAYFEPYYLKDFIAG